MTIPAVATSVAFEDIPCELCGTYAATLIATQPDYASDDPQRFCFVCCAGCNVLRQNPRPTAATVGAFYPDDYIPYQPAVTSEPLLARLGRRYGLAKRLRAVAQYHQPGRLLDVGCATGDFLTEVQRTPGWQPLGIEPNQRAAVHAGRVLDGAAVSGYLNAAPFGPATFDVITLWDVLEHVYDPATVLDAALTLLRPGGLLVLSLPNLESLDRRLFGRFWCGYDLPRHTYLFSATQLQAELARRGARLLAARCLYGNHSAFVTSLAFIARERFGAAAALRTHALLLHPMLRLAAAPCFWLLDRLGLGSNKTWFFQKEAA